MIQTGQRAGRWAKTHGATVLHGHGLRWLPLFTAASVVSGLPLVVTLHNLVPKRMSAAERAVLRVSLLRARAVIAVSEAVADSAKHAGVSRPTVIRNGIALERFALPPDEKEKRRTAIRADLSFPADAPVVLTVARLSPEKDVAGVLEAFALALPRLPDSVRLLIAGSGPLRETLGWQARLLQLTERVTFLGPRSDIPDFLAASDVFALASREEGLGLAVVEAMAAGLPLIVTNVGGLPEVVIGGETGTLVPPRDPVAMADALVQLLSNPAQAHAFGQAGQIRARTHFNEDAMMAATHAVYHRVTGK